MDGSASIGLEQALLGHSLGFAPFAAPTQVYVSLCLASTVPSETVPGLEASGGGYARMPATFALIAGPSNVAANTTSIEFPQALTSWGQIGFFELWDAASGGNRLYWGQLVDTGDFTTPVVLQVSAGDITRFSAGTLGVQASTGAGGTASIGAYLPLAGGQMAGPLLLAQDPLDYLEAATKQYVDAHSGTAGGPGFLPLSGGTMLGQLTFTTLNSATGGTISGFGTGVGQALGPLIGRGAGAVIPSLELHGQLIFNAAAPNWNYDADLFLRHDGTAVTGGNLTNITKVLAVRDIIGPLDSSAHYTSLVQATSTGHSGGQVVGHAVVTTRNPGGTDHMWGALIEVDDMTQLSSGTIGQPTLCLEMDLAGSLADDYVNIGKFGGRGSRHFFHCVMANKKLGSPYEITTGIWFTGTGNDGSYIDSVLGVGYVTSAPGTMIRNLVDSRGGIPPTGSTNPVAVATMAPGHIIDFNGSMTTIEAPPGNYLQYTTTGTPRLRYMAGVNERWSVSDTGVVAMPGLPTSNAGLSSGALWNNGGFVCVA